MFQYANEGYADFTVKMGHANIGLDTNLDFLIKVELCLFLEDPCQYID